MYAAQSAKAAIPSNQRTDRARLDIKTVIRGVDARTIYRSYLAGAQFADDLLLLGRAAKLTSDFGCGAFFASSADGTSRCPADQEGIDARPDYGFRRKKGKILMGRPHFRRVGYAHRRIFADLW